MPVFEYIALNANGKQIKGSVDADSVRSARQKLRARDVFPTEIKESLEAKKQKSRDVKEIFWKDRVSLKELATATRLLATLINAGLPLISALASLAEQMDSPTLKRVIIDIRERVEQGSSFAKSLGAYPKIFPRLFINMVASGEASGTLDSVLENLAEYYEAQLELKRRVGSALLYPILMFAFCSLVVIGLVTFVAPSIVEIFIKQKLVLPLPTQIIIMISHLFTGYWWLIILVAITIIYCLRLYYSQPTGRAWFDRIMLKVPIYGPIYKKVATARVASTLGTLLQGGVELLAALDIVRNIVGNTHMRKALEESRDGVREGRSLSKELSKSGYFPNLLSQMIAIGEKSGKLEVMLGKAGKTFSADANASISGLTSLIEPLMILVLGGIVFIIVISILLPMGELLTSAQHMAR